MEEIEILVRLNESKEKVLANLKKYKSLGMRNVLDIYYYDPKRLQLKQDKEGRLRECFRIRKKGAKSFITYKIDYFEKNRWSHSE